MNTPVDAQVGNNQHKHGDNGMSVGGNFTGVAPAELANAIHGLNKEQMATLQTITLGMAEHNRLAQEKTAEHNRPITLGMAEHSRLAQKEVAAEQGKAAIAVADKHMLEMEKVAAQQALAAEKVAAQHVIETNNTMFWGSLFGAVGIVGAAAVGALATIAMKK
jgi:CHASE3 domain sensor protein